MSRDIYSGFHKRIQSERLGLLSSIMVYLLYYDQTADYGLAKDYNAVKLFQVYL